MALFAVNTGLRDSNVCGLQWTWEVAVPELGRSVFVIPPEAFKTKRPHVVILNDVAWSIIEAQRSLASDLGLPVSRQAYQHHEQQRLAAAPDAKRDCRWFASMTFATRSRVDCERRAFPPKIAKHSLVMPIIRWPAIMRVPMWVAY